MEDKAFVPCILNAQLRADLIRRAYKRVVFCGPGISLVELDAVLHVQQRLPERALRLLVDLSAESYRVGYWGDTGIDKLDTLNALQGSIQQGHRWRLGLLVVDDCGYIYTPTPLSLEPEQDKEAGPNGLCLDADLTQLLLDSISRRGASVDGQRPTVTPALVEQVKAELHSSGQKLPKENRLLERLRQRVTIVQFEVRGFQLSRRSLKLPDEIVDILGSDKLEINERLAASWRLFADTDKALDGMQKGLESELARLKAKHLVKLSHFGFGVTDTQYPAFRQDWDTFLAKRVEQYRQKLRDKVGEMVEQSRGLLRELLEERYAKGRLELPPEKTMRRRPDADRLADYIEQLIASVRWPTVDDVLSDLEIKLREYDITASLLADKDFVEVLEKALEFKLAELDEEAQQLA